MLYCLPVSFYNDLKTVSDRRQDFIKQFKASSFELNDTIQNVDPVSYMISMIMNQESLDSNDIVSLRTYGPYHALKPYYDMRQCSTFFGCKYFGNILISYPKVRSVRYESGEVLYQMWDETYDNKINHTINSICNDHTRDSLDAFFEHDEDIFEPANIKVKIPISLVKNLA